MNEHGRHDQIKKVQIVGSVEKNRTKLVKDSNNFAIGLEVEIEEIKFLLWPFNLLF